MSKKIMAAVLAGVVAFTATSAVAQWSFAKGRFSGFGQLEWESSCSKPYFPNAAYADEYQARRVSTEYAAYVDCVVEQARDDSDYAARRVVDQATSEIDEIKSDAELAGWNVR